MGPWFPPFRKMREKDGAPGAILQAGDMRVLTIMKSKLDIRVYPAAWAEYRGRWMASWMVPLAILGLYFLRRFVEMADRGHHCW